VASAQNQTIGILAVQKAFTHDCMIKGRRFILKVMAFNGSPRKKNWNTITLLKKALEGAASVGAETELIQSVLKKCFSS
jgi:hypothetical protein